MKAEETELLNILKAKIEDIARLGPSSGWKQRDFLNLIDQVHHSSGILLSLSTIRRIWNIYHRNIPHTSTLDALSIFAGYKDYHDFRISADKDHRREDKDIHPELKDPVKWKRKNEVLFSITVVLVLIVVIVSRLIRTVELSFYDSFRIYDSIPAKVHFPVKSRGLLTDEVYFQPSLRTDMKVQVDKLKELSFRYTFPGCYQPVLWHGTRACDTMTVLFKTSGWNAYVISYNQHDEPAARAVLSEEMIRKDGFLGIDESFYGDNNINVDGTLFTQYYFVSDSFDIDADNFIFEIRLKSDSIYNYPYPQFLIGLLIDKNVAYAGFGDQAFARDNDVRFGDTYLKGNTTDLSQLSCNVYNWQDITFSNTNKELSILRNSHEIYKLKYTSDPGALYGFNISFLGSGRIGSISLKNIKGEIIYKDTFQGYKPMN